MNKILTLAACLCFGLASAQDQSYLHNRTVMDRVPTTGQVGNSVILGSMSNSPSGTVGDVYLNKDYRVATFWLYEDDKVVQDIPSKLDMQRNEFDLYLGKGNIKALPGSKVRTMIWADSVTKTRQYFVNAKEFNNEDGVPFLGFFQIVCEGDLNLYRLNTVTFKPADHNPTHYTGSKDNRFIKHTKMYYARDNKALELPGRKGILKLMESHKEEIDKFIKVNLINFSNERHVVALFDYYNSLVTPKG